MKIIAINKRSGEFRESVSLAQVPTLRADPEYVLLIVADDPHDAQPVVQILDLDHMLTQELSTIDYPKLKTIRDHVVVVFDLTYAVTRAQDLGHICCVLEKDLLLLVGQQTGVLLIDLVATAKTDPDYFTKGSDFLLCLVAQTILDRYEKQLTAWRTQLNVQEDLLLTKGIVSFDNATGTKHISQHLSEVRRNLTYMQVSIAHAIDILHKLARIDHDVISIQARALIDELLWQVGRLEDIAKQVSDLTVGFYQLYASLRVDRTNEIMQLNTIIATIFLPLMFITSLYGMNFKIPELKYEYAYFVVLGVMATITICSVAFFKRKQWF